MPCMFCMHSLLCMLAVHACLLCRQCLLCMMECYVTDVRVLLALAALIVVPACCACLPAFCACLLALPSVPACLLCRQCLLACSAGSACLLALQAVPAMHAGMLCECYECKAETTDRKKRQKKIAGKKGSNQPWGQPPSQGKLLLC
jgi:hypothetical protein